MALETPLTPTRWHTEISLLILTPPREVHSFFFRAAELELELIHTQMTQGWTVSLYIDFGVCFETGPEGPELED